jgi:small subunit ribosomal protein S20
MPILKSSIKSVRKIAKRREKNDYFRNALKKAIDFAKKSNYSEDKVKEAIKLIDKLEAKGILHKNNAARKKSSLMRKFNNAEKSS